MAFSFGRRWRQRNKRDLSIVVVAYNMARELPRTLMSLSARYQRDIRSDEYEVIVVDNGSTPAVDPKLLKSLPDLNPDARGNVAGDVEFCPLPADAMSTISDESVDIVFASNFLEHLRTKEECDAVLAEVQRILRPGGRFVIMGPNIRYLTAEYWDFYDHCLPLSHLSLEEGLMQADYEIERIVARFLPYTTRSRLPQHPALIALYLKTPLVWRLLGKQFLVVGRKPAHPRSQ